MSNRIAFLPPQKRCFNWAGYLLGFSLAGLFDGIVLHLILQWHHLFSGIKRVPFDEPHIELLADGLFLALMCIVAILGVRKLLQARYVLLDPSANRLLAANVLIGFGAWNVGNGLVAHWLLDMHHVRLDVPEPMRWDIVWFVLFGVLFIAAGIALRMRRDPPSQDDREKRGGPHSTQA